MAKTPSRTRPREPGPPLGPLESRVLDALWARGEDCRVKDLQPRFPEIAYTTLMTTLERLFRKGVLDRFPVGRAFAYRPRVSRFDLQAKTATQAIRHLVESGAELGSVLSLLVDQIDVEDVRALDELERLVQERRRAIEEGK